MNERADLYSFAMVIFEILSGRLAYEEKGQIALIAEKLEKSALPLRQAARVPIPAGLDVVIDTCLARDPSERYKSATEVLAQWRALGAATLVPSPAATTGNVPTSPPTQTGLTAPTILSTSTPNASRASIALAVGAVIASSLIIAAMIHHRTETAAAASLDSSLVTAIPSAPDTAASPSAEPSGDDVDSIEIGDPSASAGATPNHAPTHHTHHGTHHKSSEPTIMDKPRF